MPAEKAKRIQHNKATAYLTPSNQKFVEKYVDEKSASKSELINDALALMRKACESPLPMAKQLSKHAY